MSPRAMHVAFVGATCCHLPALSRFPGYCTGGKACYVCQSFYCGVYLSKALLKSFAVALAFLAHSMGRLVSHGTAFHTM